MAAIAGCPDGTEIEFPANQTYTQTDKIVVQDRSNLVIDGNGSTFNGPTGLNGCNHPAGIRPNWLLLRGSNMTLKNMTSSGSFDLPPPRSLAAESADRCYTEASPNYGVYGTDTAWLVDVKGSNAWGDNVTVGPAHYALPYSYRDDDFATDVHIIRMEARKPARMCWAPTSGIGTWIEDSSCTDAWYAALDAETDGRTQPLKNQHYLRNTFNGFNLGLLIPVPGVAGTVTDIEVRGNTFLTGPDNQCHPTILVGGYPDIDGPNPPMTTYELSNVRVEDNTMSAVTRAVVFDHVKAGTIFGNKITRIPPPNGARIEHFCGSDPGLIDVQRSADINQQSGTSATTSPTTLNGTTRTTVVPEAPGPSTATTSTAPDGPTTAPQVP